MKNIIFLFFLVLSSCAGTATPIPDASSPDARLFQQRCSLCHSLPHPQRLTADAWPHWLDQMQQRMREQDVPLLSEEEFRRILSYLQQHAAP